MKLFNTLWIIGIGVATIAMIFAGYAVVTHDTPRDNAYDSCETACNLENMSVFLFKYNDGSFSNIDECVCKGIEGEVKRLW